MKAKEVPNVTPSEFKVQWDADLVLTQKVIKDIKRHIECGCGSCTVESANLRDNWFGVDEQTLNQILR